MSNANHTRHAGGVTRFQSGRAADLLHFAAAPTFAIMALLTGVSGGESDFLCSAGRDSWAVGGMVPMYTLMSAFHSAPWLKLIASRRNRAGDGNVCVLETSRH